MAVKDYVIRVYNNDWDYDALEWVPARFAAAAGGSQVEVTNFPASQAVTGSFFQATQPVSIASMPSTPVTGTFFQATQPVSLASVPTHAVTASGAFNPGTSAGKTITYVPVAQGAAGTTQLAAASGANKHKVIGCVLTLSAAGTIKFTDASGDLTGAMDVAASGGFVLPASLFPYTETGAINRAISIVTTVGAAKGVVALLTEP